MAEAIIESGVSARAAGGRLLDAVFLRKLERLALVSKKAHLGIAKGERKSRRKGSSVEFADYRDYVQGDDLRHVDWNLAGRLNALYLKLFQEQEDLTLHVLIDASGSMGFGTPPKIDFACKVAAALGYIALAGFDRLSVQAFTGNSAMTLPACRGKGSATKFFSFLERIRTGGLTMLDYSCRSYLLRHRGKGVAILLSDFLDPAGYEPCLRRLCMSGCDLFVVHVLSRDDVDPQISGDLRLVDSETKAFTEITMSRALLRHYHENLENFRAGLRRDCLARGIGFIPAISDADFDRLTLELLRQGGAVK